MKANLTEGFIFRNGFPPLHIWVENISSQFVTLVWYGMSLYKFLEETRFSCYQIFNPSAAKGFNWLYTVILTIF